MAIPFQVVVRTCPVCGRKTWGDFTGTYQRATSVEAEVYPCAKRCAAALESLERHARLVNRRRQYQAGCGVVAQFTNRWLLAFRDLRERGRVVEADDLDYGAELSYPMREPDDYYEQETMLQRHPETMRWAR